MADFWDMLTNAFTGAPQQAAAQQQQGAIAGQNAQIAALIAAAQAGGIDALKSGQYSGADAILKGILGAQGAIGAYLPQATGALTNYYNTGVNALTGGQSNAISALTGSLPNSLAALQMGLSGATGAYDPLLSYAKDLGSRGTTAADAAFNALGLNGPGGNDAARAMFQSSPGYQFALDQGLNAVSRGANAAGMVASGNELQASQKFGQGLANQDWYNWLDRITGQENTLLPLGLQGLTSYAQGVAPLYSNYGNAASSLYSNLGTNLSNIYTGTAKSLSDLASTAGGKLSDLYAGAGSSLADISKAGGLSLANLYSGTGANLANLLQGLSAQQTNFSGQSLNDLLSTYGLSANAETGGSANLWNAIGGAAKLAAAIPTGGLSLAIPTNNPFTGTGSPTRPALPVG